MRHGVSNLLRENDADINTAQELLRHADNRITLDIDQQTVTGERRAARKLAVNTLWGGENLCALKNPDCDEN
jgi:hypothetical protein